CAACGGCSFRRPRRGWDGRRASLAELLEQAVAEEPDHRQEDDDEDDAEAGPPGPGSADAGSAGGGGSGPVRGGGGGGRGERRRAPGIGRLQRRQVGVVDGQRERSERRVARLPPRVAMLLAQDGDVEPHVGEDDLVGPRRPRGEHHGERGYTGTHPTSSPGATSSSRRTASGSAISPSGRRRKRAPVATKCGTPARSTATIPGCVPSPPSAATRARRASRTRVTSPVRAVKCGPPSNGSIRPAWVN